MARQRYVYPTDEIPHKWAHAAQDSARNPQGNLSFLGDTIRSYSTDVAKIYRHKAHGTLVLIAQRTYSVTTAKQLGLIRRAVSHLHSVTVPFPVIGRYGAGMHTADGAHAANVKFLTDNAAKALAKAQRAMSASSVSYGRAQAQGNIEDAARYMAFFGMRGKRPAFPETEWNAAAARAERIENPDPASADKRERASARRRMAADEVAEYRAEMARSMTAAGHYLPYRATRGKNWARTIANLAGRAVDKHAEFLAQGAARTDWRLFGAFDTPGVSYRDNACMLRVNGEQIETSQGARIPLAAAPMVWRMVEHARENGGRNYEGRLGYKIGDYRVTRIDADGTLVVGCHSIPHSELRSMARQLGLAEQRTEWGRA